MSEELFDDEETTESGKKSGPRFLPSKTTIKDDLQEIYDTERQIGSAVFKLHQLIGQVQETLGKKADSEEVSEGLEDLNLYLETNSKAVQDRLTEIKAAADVFTNHLVKIDNDWLRVQRATNETLKSHGIDPQTLAEESDKIKKLGRWMTAIQMVGVSIIVTLISAWIMSSVSKTIVTDQKAVNDQLLQQNQQILLQNQQLERTMEEHILLDEQKFRRSNDHSPEHSH